MDRLLRAVLFVCMLFSVVAYTPLSDETLQNLPAAGSDFDVKTGSILAPILIPRVPGTPGSTAVQQHFVEWFKTNLPEWTIEFQNSTSRTPATGNRDVPFANIIVTRDPPWTRPGDVGRLALVAHYDSKLTPAGFIGATDSAAPCAMIMHAARSVNEALTRKWSAMQAEGSYGLEEEKGVQILLLDGEEAFVSWTNDDSLYGARFEPRRALGDPLLTS
jgi:glutaminyl-peptide cyclotransferase